MNNYTAGFICLKQKVRSFLMFFGEKSMRNYIKIGIAGPVGPENRINRRTTREMADKYSVR